MSHVFPAYPSFADAQNGASAILEHRPGGPNPDVKEATHGCYVVLGFGLSMYPGAESQPRMAASEASLDDLLKQHLLAPHAAGMQAGAVPWQTILSMVLALLQQLLAAKTP